MKKKFLVILPFISVSFLTGCSNQSKIVLEGDFEESYELINAPLCFPDAHVEDGSGELISYDVIYRLVNNDTNESIDSEFPSFRLGVGNYTLKYVYKNISNNKSFKVVDTIAPTIEISNVPASLYIQDIKVDESQILPSYSIDDLSDIDTVDQVLLFNGEPYDESLIDKRHDKYTVTEYGLFTYKVTASDIYGNTATETVSWLIKDKDWVPESIDENCLLDFNEPGYTNYFSVGTMNPYYVVKDFTEEHLDSYEGASGVSKVHLPFVYNSAKGNVNSLTIRLPKTKQFTYDEIKNKYLTVRLRVEGYEDALVSNDMFFAGNVNETRQGGVNEALTCGKRIPLNEWTTVYVKGETAAKYGLFPDSSFENSTSYYDKIDGICSSFQIAFSELSGMGPTKYMDLYLDYVAIADTILDRPDAYVDGNTLHLENDIEHEYLIDNNGITQKVKDISTYQLNSNKGYVSVKRLANSPLEIDSDFVTRIYGMSGDYDINFNDELLNHSINQSLTFNTNDEFENFAYRYKSLTTSYTNEGMNIELGASEWKICNGFSIDLPNPINPVDCKSFILNTKFSSLAFTSVRIFDEYGTLLKNLSLTNEDIGVDLDIEISIASLGHKINTLQFIFNNSDFTGVNSYVFSLNHIFAPKTLDTPNLSYDNVSSRIIWDPVNNASSYLVYLNGVESIVTNTYVDVTTDLVDVRVIAQSNSIMYSASKTACMVKYNSSFVSALEIDVSEGQGGYSSTSGSEKLVQIGNIKLPLDGTDADINAGTSSAEYYSSFDTSNVQVTKNGTVTTGILVGIHYHSAHSILQPHFDSNLAKTNNKLQILQYSSFFIHTSNVTSEKTFFVFNRTMAFSIKAASIIFSIV